MFQSNEIHLADETFQVTQGKGEAIPYKVHTGGLYLVVESINGLVLMWDRKTTLVIKLSSEFTVGLQIYGRILPEAPTLTELISYLPRENSVVFVGITMGTSRMILPPATRKLWWKALILETAGKCHLPAPM